MMFSSFGVYKCKDCGEIFENRVQAMIHHVATKHQNYELVDTGINMTLKS